MHGGVKAGGGCGSKADHFIFRGNGRRLFFRLLHGASAHLSPNAKARRCCGVLSGYHILVALFGLFICVYFNSKLGAAAHLSCDWYCNWHGCVFSHAWVADYESV